MIKLTVSFTYNRPAAILLLVIVISLLLTGSAAALERPDAQVNGSVFMPHSSGRHFYLTNSTYNGSQARTACAPGYHMASFWEIRDVTNLTYDYNHWAAYNKADSGYGPPSYWYGWVRTGADSSGVNTAGTGNCLTWTDASGSNSGVAVRLTRTWETPPSEIKPWDATSFSCNTISPVWCVGNFFVVDLPLVIKP